MKQQREVRFLLDWWESGTEKYAMEPSDYGLSDELTLRLRRFYDHWFQHVDPVMGWDTEENLAIYHRDKEEVLQLLRDELSIDVNLLAD
ncbi:metal ion transport protein [Leifsonia xyli subsp. cynodontis DSM 46306]|uniref:Uncharacterized protein n=1 Tax=Leifsonia xyli subsp. cynodontis DSM 46306 TaxID=1389489 RepID=U3PG69_LEIXC|nr:hypothetical protein [Leifsonia xyli]AGW42673.1 metal ion transport protein [Leifsonia xyli subsp. cynodontis DSM 46306]